MRVRWRRRLRRVAAIALTTGVGASVFMPSPGRIALYRLAGAVVEPGVFVRPHVVLRPGAIRIGSGTRINYGCFLDPGEGLIDIGRNVSIGTRAVLAADSHVLGGSQRRAAENASSVIRIHDGSWIGAGATILPGITIGAGAVVGAGSVVTRDVEDNTVAAGNPARLLRRLDG